MNKKPTIQYSIELCVYISIDTFNILYIYFIYICTYKFCKMLLNVHMEDVLLLFSYTIMYAL